MRKNLESITTRQNIDALKAPGGDRSQLALCEAFESLTSRLGRAPTLKELSFELSMKDPSFNVDKVRRTLAQINARSNNSLLKTTPGRPDIVYEALVKDVYLKYLADHAEPPTREQFRAALEAHNCFIPHATVLSILKRAREATEPADYQWRLLKTTSLIPARDLVEAYRQAKNRLILIGDERNPTKYQISCVLNEMGIPATAELVKKRLETLNTNRSDKLETHPTHFSPASRLMEYCYQRFEDINKRPPTVQELRAEMNRLAFHKLDHSSVIQLLSRVRHNSDSSLPVERKRPISISNQELQIAYQILRERRGRIPVLTELQEHLREQHPDKRVDTSDIKKILQNTLHLRFYDSVAEAVRETLKECIPALHNKFGLAPSAYDVQEYLLKFGYQVSRKYISEILIQLRASGADLELRRGSGFGRTYRERLQIAYKAYINANQAYPNSMQLAEKTGLNADAVTSIAQVINAKADPSADQLMIIASTSNEVLNALRSLGKKPLSETQRDSIKQLNIELACLDSTLPALSDTTNDPEYIRSIELAKIANFKIATDAGEAIYQAEITQLRMQKRFLMQDKSAYQVKMRLFALYTCLQVFSERDEKIQKSIDQSSSYSNAVEKLNELFDSYCQIFGVFSSQTDPGKKV